MTDENHDGRSGSGGSHNNTDVNTNPEKTGITNSEEIRQQIRHIALTNAMAHGGQTRHGNVLGKILGSKKDLRDSVSEISKMVSDTVSEVNAMPQERQAEMLSEIGHTHGQGQSTGPDGSLTNTGRGGSSNNDDQLPGAWLPPLEGAEYGKVITRFPPEPNGYPHIGHAKAAIINTDYAAKYGGRCLLRIDDTNPEAERKEYLAGINVGLEWLGIEFRPEDVKYTSDDMETLYKKGEELIQAGRAYVCTCKKDDISKNRMERRQCKCCKKDDADEHYKRWMKMHEIRYKSGGAIVRFRGDMLSDNAVMRDPVLFRIITTPHYRQGSKYAVWPSYDMSVAIEDSIHGVTHALRSKEFESRADLIHAILDALNMRKPRQYYFSRLAFDGMPTSKRVIKPLMEDGKISGYDDPRIPTLGGLRRRGIKPQAVRKFIESLGMTKADTVAPFQTLESLNRSMIDPQSTRLFMTKNPKRLIIGDIEGKMNKTSVDMPNHPLLEEMGTRITPVSHDMYISGDDFEKLEEGSIIRLLGLAYVVVSRISNVDEGSIYRAYGQRDKKPEEEEAAAVYADYFADLDVVFNARDRLEFYDRKNISISQQKRTALEMKIRKEESFGDEEDISRLKQKRPKTEEDIKMQWVSRSTAIPIRLTIPKKPFDGERFNEDSLVEAEVYTEPHFNNIKEGAEIQFVRFGYCRKDTGRRVIFTHD